MIISVEELMEMTEFQGISEKTLERKVKGIEELVRAYTNNNFQNRTKRISAPSLNGKLLGRCQFFKAGDTVQISESVNAGLYVVKEIDLLEKNIKVDTELFDASANLVTKVEYPSAVVDGVMNLLLWEVKNRDKIGIHSETLSRHSVTYTEQNEVNTLMGYPVTLFGFLKPYMKARF